MRFKATDVFDFFKPSKCVLRVALRARGEPEQDTDTPFVELLRRLGDRHEKAHLASLPSVVDLSTLDQTEREDRTLEAIRAGAPAIYQPRFSIEIDLDGDICELVGEPDFLIRDAARGGYLIRDSKLARNVLSPRNAGIRQQLQIYGLLFERAVGQPPVGLEVHAGSGELVPLAYDGEAAVLDSLREHQRMRRLDPAAYEPVAWSKCGGCGYHDRCWGEAEAREDVALLTTVYPKRARELHARGIVSIRDIPGAIDDPAHRGYFWTGKKKPRVKDFVPEILKSAESRLSKTAIRKAPPVLPKGPSFAMFDLEGLPPYLDDLDRIYLWGLKVCGDKPSGYRPAQAGFGPGGDREGWLAFLRLVDRLFADYGPDLPFVHWSQYERTKLEDCIGRYGDPDGVAARLKTNLFDLLSAVKDSVVLPLPSYSLKVVEGYVGFRRRLPEANGSWSIAKYIEATETDDHAARAAILNQILAYNEEDLDATWAVMEWLRRPAPLPVGAGVREGSPLA